MVLHARRIVPARSLDAGKTGNDNEKLRGSELGCILLGKLCSYDGINEPNLGYSWTFCLLAGEKIRANFENMKPTSGDTE